MDRLRVENRETALPQVFMVVDEAETEAEKSEKTLQHNNGRYRQE